MNKNNSLSMGLIVGLFLLAFQNCAKPERALTVGTSNGSSNTTPLIAETPPAHNILNPPPLGPPVVGAPPAPAPAPAATATFTASANPVVLPAGAICGKVSLNWQSSAVSVNVFVNTLSGILFTSGGAVGSATTGEWVCKGPAAKFFLQDRTSGQLLANLDVAVFEASLHIVTNPAKLDLSRLDQATLSWNAPAGVNAVEIRVDQGDGTMSGLFAQVGPSGSVPMPPWVQEGTTFYLQNANGGSTTNPADTISQIIVHVQ